MERLKELRASRRGFTLVEIIVVLVIIAILAAIAIPAMTGFVQEAKDQALISEARASYVAAQNVAVRETAKGVDVDHFVGGMYWGEAMTGGWPDAIAPYITSKDFYFSANSVDGVIQRIVYSEDLKRFAHIDFDSGQVWVDQNKDINAQPPD